MLQDDTQKQSQGRLQKDAGSLSTKKGGSQAGVGMLNPRDPATWHSCLAWGPRVNTPKKVSSPQHSLAEHSLVQGVGLSSFK